jgi:acetylornithine deacetylase/succinyl-diaminopimelate desuccinylase-like protein
MRWIVLVTCCAALAACSSDRTTAKAAAPAKAAPKLGIRPAGDTEIQPDLGQLSNEDLKKVFAYIDDHIDEHVGNLQKWIRQPSISNSGEGIPESAEMVKGFFEQLGCQQARVYDVGVTEWGAPGNPVVYAKCDEGAPRTLVIYWQYDTMPVTQPDAWKVPPFEGRLVEQPPFKKVLIGRGATNSKGPEMAQWNALMSIKAVTGKLPVNIIFVAEGDEERMDIGLRKFVVDHPDLFAGADAMFHGGGQGASGGGGISGSSEGCVYIELTTSGRAWGRGPVQSDIHGANKRAVDSPAWRHIKMLASLVSDDGNTPLVKGFTDGMQPLNQEEIGILKRAAERVDMKVAAANIGVARYISDDPFTMLKMARAGVSFNLDGIWGGNMYAGGAGAILPNKITSKHNMRYVPNMHGLDMVKRIREQLDRNGYKDVEMKVVGDVPWSKMSYDTDIARSIEQMYDAFHISYSPPSPHESILSGGYWPSYLFGNGEVGQRVAPVQMPIAGGAAGHGGNAHAANEYYVIEGAGKVYGMAGAEKSVAAIVYNFAAKNGAPKPRTTN